MKTNRSHLFKSERLGFRNWESSDIEPMSEINSDEKVMEFFSRTQTKEQTIEFIDRMQKQFAEKEYCYFAVDKLEDNVLIGFIGINLQTFESDFTPCIDIGWRLKSSEWNKGYATEGAKRCLEYASKDLGIKKVYSITPVVNLKSEKIMLNIGMKKVKYFIFPALKDDERLYEIDLPTH